jgi:hypothetical protein
MRTRNKAGMAKTGLKTGRRLPQKGRITKGGAKLGARRLQSHAYVDALKHDRRLRSELDDAYRSLAKAYRRSSGRRGVRGAVLDDRKTRRELRRAGSSLRGATDRLQGARARKTRRRNGRIVLLLAVSGGVCALVFSEDLRARLTGLVSGSGGDYGQGSNGAGPASGAEAHSSVSAA